MEKNIKIFSGSSGCKLAGKVANILNLPLGEAKILKFKDGEYYTKIEESVRGCDVFVVQSTSTPVNQNIMGLLIFIDALRRASANTINIVMPYYGYARQDRKASPREPITSKLIANLLTTAGADRVVTMDLHTSQTQGFFDIPVDHLQGLPVLAKNFIEKDLIGDGIVVVASGANGVKRARKLAEHLDCKIAIIDRRESVNGSSPTIDIIGDVEGMKVIFIDGFIDTGRSVIAATEAVIEKGAIEVYACCTHGIFSGQAIKDLDNSSIKEIFTTDSIKLNAEYKSTKIKVLSVDYLFAETLKRIINNESIESITE